ncbi:unnamed protein product [Adineta steineri]|uniref:V-SNARE coiled-coil homology domain-containing protein n=1 Tax=Adineta steineri TaxID=433720 RepID=A0A819UHQ6_9BILA|nr:unnamed protein product [Adineta steineri]CAF4095563.1 unnamed protein product [Adineta steineri]
MQQKIVFISTKLLLDYLWMKYFLKNHVSVRTKSLRTFEWWKATGSTNGVGHTSPSSVQQLHGQVDEVMNVMRNNIALELERDGALHDIEHKSSILTEGARDLYLGSKELKKKYWWKNQRIWIILYIIVALVITIIIIATVAGGKK